MPPKVSIITALHNKEPYIAESIESVLSQTMADWELIVVENASSDHGVDVVQGFSDARIRLIISPQCGPGAARNSGLEKAQGAWVLFFDADDLLECDYLKHKMEAAENHPEAVIVAGCWKEFLDHAPKITTLRQPATYRASLSTVLDSAIASAPWVLHAAIVRRDWLSSQRQWPVELDALPAEDASFWFCLLLGARLAWSDDSAALYRLGLSSSREGSASLMQREKALRGIVDYNLHFMRGLALAPSSAQCATLTRVFEQSYHSSLSGGAREAAKEALQAANYWLAQAPWKPMPFALRKLVHFLRYGSW
jgi:glycosyltransferase involved in cell wall biosynthesis